MRRQHAPHQHQRHAAQDIWAAKTVYWKITEDIDAGSRWEEQSGNHPGGNTEVKDCKELDVNDCKPISTPVVEIDIKTPNDLIDQEIIYEVDKKHPESIDDKLIVESNKLKPHIIETLMFYVRIKY